MGKVMPEWLKRNYNALWGRFGNGVFVFGDVARELGSSRSMTIKTLVALEVRGFLSKERSEIDNRERVYRLVSPEDIAFAVGLYSLMEKERILEQALMDRFVMIGEKLKYAITGSHAAFYYHRYMNPPRVVEVKVELLDEGKWIAFLTDDRTRVFLGGVIETRKVENYVSLMHSSRPLETIRKPVEQGYYVEKPEFLVVELLERETLTSVIEAVAIIVRGRSEVVLDGPEGVVDIARSSGVLRRLGFLLDAVNLEAGVPVIGQDVIDDIRKDVVGRSSEVFPRDEIFLSRVRELRNRLAHGNLLTAEETEELERAGDRLEGYKELGKEWGLQVILPRNVIRKVLDDLGVQLAGN